MSVDDNTKKDSTAKDTEKFSEEEQKEIIEKFKAQLLLEDEEDLMLYAALLKNAT